MQFGVFDSFFGVFWELFGIFSIMFFIIPAVVCIMVIVIMAKACRASTEAIGGFTAEAPSFVIPRRYRGQTRSDGSEIRTVRLPEKCPSCGASLSHEDIDWTGPLEARCNYCGGTVRAQFDRI
ncbi:MAG: hypothetical protein EAX95_08445 [Candidatus Thorarchaeota archaeon]|nr:hypothetical protein [Candidatus Thorarchaeota archaeon]